MSTNRKREDDDHAFEVLDAICEDAAQAAADDPGAEFTEEDQRWADAMRARMTRKIAEARRSLLPKSIKPVVVPPIRRRYLAMTREHLIARLEELAQQLGGLQIAHRKLEVLCDDDLRRMLETLDPDRSES